MPSKVDKMGQKIRHFVGAESSKQLAFIDDLHKLGLNHTVDLPELVVVGDQNTGKSSVLQAITEISFPVEETLCTRFPIKISFRQSPTNPKVKAEILPGPISQNDDSFIERIREFSFESEELNPETMKRIVKEATHRIFGAEELTPEPKVGDHQSKPRPTVSDAILRIERSGPNEMHWTIVDLPGLVQNEQPSEAQKLSNAVTNGESDQLSNAVISETLVRQFLNNERSIVLVVIDAVDVERQRSLRIIEGIPGLQSRSIGVLTNCDRKQETSDLWMVKLLRNELPTACHLEHGWFGLRNRKPIEINVSDAERDENEMIEFSKPEWDGVSSDRKGIKALMNYVDKERRAQLQKNMPHIISEIRECLRSCEKELGDLGGLRNTAVAQRHYAYKFCMEMSNLADAALHGREEGIPSVNTQPSLRSRVRTRLAEFYNRMMFTEIPDCPFGNSYVHDLQELRSSSSDPLERERLLKENRGIYGEIYKEAEKLRGTNLPGTIHPDVEEKIFRRQSARWKDISIELVEDLKSMMRECNNVLLKKAIPDSRTRMEIIAVTEETQVQWNRQIDASLEDLLEDNNKRPLITYDPLFASTIRLCDQRLGEILYGKKAADENSPTAETVDSDNNEPAGLMSTELSLVLYTRARLEAYYDIAIKRFIDNVAMQVVERHILGPNCPIRAVSAKLLADLSDEDLNRIAGEDEGTSRRRTRLEKDKSRYRQALARWDQIRSL